MACCISSFICLNVFLFPLLISFDPLVAQERAVWFQCSRIIQFSLLLLIFRFMPFWSEILQYDFYLFRVFLRLLLPNIPFILENVPCALENMYSAIVVWNVLNMFSPSSLQCCSNPPSPYWFSVWTICPFVESRILRSQTIIVLLFIFPFTFGLYIEVLQHRLMVNVKIPRSSLKNWCLYHSIMSFFVAFNIFKVYFIYYKYSYPCILLSFAWNIFLAALLSVFKVEVSLVGSKHIIGSRFF